MIKLGTPIFLREEFGFTPDQKIVLCVGELLPNKNQTMVIHMMQEVVKIFPDAVLLLAGNGPEKENLEKEILKCGLEKNVQMLGYCIWLEKYQRAADILVSCSKREGLPLNLIEAMLTGNPVVATENRGHRELIIEGKNGYLVSFDVCAAMAEKVIDLLQNNVKRKKMGDYAKESAGKYSFESVKKQLKQIYEI